MYVRYDPALIHIGRSLNFAYMKLVSEMFQLNRWRCYMLMLIHQAAWLGWLMVLLIVGLTVTGFLLSPWIGIASLGFDIFIVVMVMSFVIMIFGFNSITGINMSMHSLSVGEKYITVTFEDETTIEIDRHDVRPYKIYPAGIIVPVAGKRPGWLWIPPKAFPDDAAFQKFLSAIYNYESNTE